MRGLSTFRVGRGWRKLITLVCLLAFVFVAAVHAGHHLAVAGDASVLTTAVNVPVDGSDGRDAKEGVCVFCALAAAELPVLPMITAEPLRVLVKTREMPLALASRAAEYPPPIT